jgi:hypothetical protein
MSIDLGGLLAAQRLLELAVRVRELDGAEDATHANRGEQRPDHSRSATAATSPASAKLLEKQALHRILRGGYRSRSASARETPMTESSLICEACKAAAVEVEIADAPDESAPPFRLCHACAGRLEDKALRPREWYELVAIHGPQSYWLHDDFYDEDGAALQPDAPVEDAGAFPVPKLAAAEGDVDKVLVAAMAAEGLARHDTPELIAALEHLPQDALLAALPTQVRRSEHREARAYRIAALVLRERAAGWIREQASRRRSGTFVGWACAAAACLPPEEGFGLVIAALTPTTPVDVVSAALSDFRSRRTLDWIEDNVRDPLTEDWGRLAARSGFDWPRASAWLARGRPLSLVALDAINACHSYHFSERREGLTPTLGAPAPKEEMAAALRAYGERDPALRVERAVRYAIDNLDKLAGERGSTP